VLIDQLGMNKRLTNKTQLQCGLWWEVKLKNKLYRALETMFTAQSVLPVREMSLLAIAQQIETIRKVERGLNYNGTSRKMCC